MFQFFAAVFILILLAGMFYLLTRFYLFWKRSGITKDKKPANLLLTAVPAALLIAFTAYKPVIGAIVIIHIMIFSLILDFITWVAKTFFHKQFKAYPQPLIAICIAAIYFFVGWHLAHDVVQTNYNLTTEKNIGVNTLRIAHITDSHLGSTFNGDGFAKHISMIQSLRDRKSVV